MRRPPPPDFVIAGAPRCGTTAVYQALQQHPDVFWTAIKEPHYFAFDYVDRRPVENAELYDSIYKHARDGQLRVDASVLYLSSREALPAIMQRRPDAKIIVLVRDPVDLFVSWHNQCLATLDEDVRDPQQAWRLQEERAAGRSLPKCCHEPLTLQYRTICSLGSQVKRLFEVVPEKQRLILLFDDLQRDPRAEYKRVVDFLGIVDDGESAFDAANAFSRPKSATIALLSRTLQVGRPWKNLRLRLKPFLNRHGIYVVEWLLKKNRVLSHKPEVSAAFRRELQEELRAEITLLARLLDRDLSSWLEDRSLAAPGAAVA